MVLQNTCCLIWLDAIECSPSPSPTPGPQVCPDLSSCSYPPTCGGFNYININWTEGYCISPDAPNGIILGPLQMYYQYNYGWVYSTPTVASTLTCQNNQWVFDYTNTSIDGTWTVQIIFQPDSNDPCNIIGLSGEGTITTDLFLGDPENCTGTFPISATISQFSC